MLGRGDDTSTANRYSVGMGDRSHFPGSMTARQFKATAKEFNFSPEGLARARRVLVDGESVLDVAYSEDVVVTSVYKVLRKLRAARRR